MDDVRKLLQYDDKESKIFIHNEIFTDLKTLRSKGSSHIAFAYAYYYLICWLYRYAKYGSINIDVKLIKQILGYNSSYQGIDYIVKKNGVLDSMNYTATTKDFPLSWTYDDCLDFDLLSDMDEDVQKIIKEARSRKYTIKFPVKTFHRTIESENDNYLDGTFYEFDNTHLVPFEVFMFCMSKKEIGCVGFYLWSYLKMKCQMFNDGYDISLDNLSQEVMIPKSTMINYLNTLRKYKMVNCYYNQEFFCVALNEDERQANTYITNEYSYFSDKPIEYQKLKVISTKEYTELVSDEHDLSELFG